MINRGNNVSHLSHSCQLTNMFGRLHSPGPGLVLILPASVPGFNDIDMINLPPRWDGGREHASNPPPGLLLLYERIPWAWNSGAPYDIRPATCSLTPSCLVKTPAQPDAGKLRQRRPSPRGSSKHAPNGAERPDTMASLRRATSQNFGAFTIRRSSAARQTCAAKAI